MLPAEGCTLLAVLMAPPPKSIKEEMIACAAAE